MSLYLCIHIILLYRSQSLLKTGPWASAVVRFDPELFPNENAIYDNEFRSVCCQSAGLCDTFHMRRPRDCCTSYIPPFRGKYQSITL